MGKFCFLKKKKLALKLQTEMEQTHKNKYTVDEFHDAISPFNKSGKIIEPETLQGMVMSMVLSSPRLLYATISRVYREISSGTEDLRDTKKDIIDTCGYEEVALNCVYMLAHFGFSVVRRIIKENKGKGNESKLVLLHFAIDPIQGLIAYTRSTDVPKEREIDLVGPIKVALDKIYMHYIGIVEDEASKTGAFVRKFLEDRGYKHPFQEDVFREYETQVNVTSDDENDLFESEGDDEIDEDDEEIDNGLRDLYKCWSIYNKDDFAKNVDAEWAPINVVTPFEVGGAHFTSFPSSSIMIDSGLKSASDLCLRMTEGELSRSYNKEIDDTMDIYTHFGFNEIDFDHLFNDYVVKLFNRMYTVNSTTIYVVVFKFGTRIVFTQEELRDEFIFNGFAEDYCLPVRRYNNGKEGVRESLIGSERWWRKYKSEAGGDNTTTTKIATCAITKLGMFYPKSGETTSDTNTLAIWKQKDKDSYFSMCQVVGNQYAYISVWAKEGNNGWANGSKEYVMANLAIDCLRYDFMEPRISYIYTI
jgi:hypothetical protein